MERALWNEKKLVAGEAAADFHLEKQVRRASTEGALVCPDPECGGILRYCHGEVKRPYFAHRGASASCGYAAYDKDLTEEVHEAQWLLYNALKKAGAEPELDAKTWKRHYANLLVNGEAWEIVPEKKAASLLPRRANAYREAGMSVRFLVLSEEKLSQAAMEECLIACGGAAEEACFLCMEAGQYACIRRDGERYLFRGLAVKSRYGDFFCMGTGTENIGADGRPAGFEALFAKWRSNKKNAFARYCAEQEEKERAREEERRRIEEQHRLLQQALAEQRAREAEEKRMRLAEEKRRALAIARRQRDLSPAREEKDGGRVVTPGISFGETKASAVPAAGKELEELLKQQKPVFDRDGTRYVRCETCGRIGPADDFASYGGPGRVNLGRCRACAAKLR